MFCVCVGILYCWLSKILNYYIQCTNTYNLNKNISIKTISHQTLSTTKSSNANKEYPAFRCIHVRTAKAYFNQFLAPQNAMYNPNV